LLAPLDDASVIGVSERDQGRDVEAFFAAHPFESESESLDSLVTDSFFRRFLDAPESSPSR
jgi:hypothetical protein